MSSLIKFSYRGWHNNLFLSITVSQFNINNDFLNSVGFLNGSDFNLSNQTDLIVPDCQDLNARYDFERSSGARDCFCGHRILKIAILD